MRPQSSGTCSSATSKPVTPRGHQDRRPYVNIERFREVCHATPFRPFVLHLADGREVPVKHPDYVAATPTGRTVVMVQPDESLNIIDLFLVTDIELKNGRRRQAARPTA
jgi:hypothetical protein